MQRSPRSWLAEFLDRLLPSPAFPPDAHRRRIRASFVLALAALQAVASGLFAVTELWAGHTVTGLLMLIGALLPVWPVIRLRADGQVDRWSQVFVANMFVLLGSIHLGSGGHSIGVVMALPVLLLISSLVSSHAQTLAWGAAVIGLMLIGSWQRGLSVDWWIPIDPAWAQNAITRVPVLMSVCVLGMAVMLRVLLDRIYADLAAARASEREAMEQARLDRQRFSDFAELAADWFWETDSDLRLTYVSPGIQTHTGLRPEAVLGRHPVDFVRERQFDSAPLREIERKMVRREPFVDEHMSWRDAHGQLAVFRNVGRPHHDAQGRFRGYRGAVTDITENWNLTRELERLARTDPLTGLLNRRAFAAELASVYAERREHGAPWWLVQFDLDHFKAVNDAAGHAVGDQVLLRVAELLSASGMPGSRLARIGGDEFCALIKEPDRAVLDDYADLIRSGCMRLERELGHRIGVSIGLLRIDPARGDIVTHLRDVDAACYRAKREGGGRVVVDGG